MIAAHEAKSTAETEAFWGDRDNLRGHATALQAARLITTSWAELVEPLADFSGCPVIFVPDYQGRWGWAFRRAMRYVWRELR